MLEIHLEAAEAAGYQAGIFSLDERPEKVNEDLDEFYDDDEDPSRNESPPLAVTEGIVRWPWFAVYYTGRSIVKVYALDQNWFDYARTNADQQEQGGGAGGLAGDNFERPLFSVEGGMGLFGSASADSVGFVVVPR